MLADYGFKVSENYRIVKSIDAAIEYIRDFDSRRKSLAYDTDGAVLKVNAVYQQDILGATGKDHAGRSLLNFRLSRLKPGWRYRDPGWAHRRADADGGTDAGKAVGQYGKQGYAAQ